MKQKKVILLALALLVFILGIVLVVSKKQSLKRANLNNSANSTNNLNNQNYSSAPSSSNQSNSESSTEPLARLEGTITEIDIAYVKVQLADGSEKTLKVGESASFLMVDPEKKINGQVTYKETGLFNIPLKSKVIVEVEKGDILKKIVVLEN